MKAELGRGTASAPNAEFQKVMNLYRLGFSGRLMPPAQFRSWNKRPVRLVSSTPVSQMLKVVLLAAAWICFESALTGCAAAQTGRQVAATFDAGVAAYDAGHFD